MLSQQELTALESIVALENIEKCMMQVCQKNVDKPKMKGDHQNCDAELNFRLDKPKVRGLL
jgi:hypothetical protein